MWLNSSLHAGLWYGVRVVMNCDAWLSLEFVLRLKILVDVLD